VEKTVVRILVFIAVLVSLQPMSPCQVALVVGDYFYDEPLPVDPSVPLRNTLTRPARPTAALEIFRYLFARYPVVRSDDGPRYQIKLSPGKIIGIPYALTEAEALSRLQVYYNHPLPGLQSAEIGSLLDLLNPESTKTETVMLQTSRGAELSSGLPYSVKVNVQSSVIPDPGNWGVLSLTPRESVTGDYLGNSTKESHINPRTTTQVDTSVLHPEAVVGKVHNRELPFTSQRVGTAWCLNAECDLMVSNYHVAQLVGNVVAVNGERVVETWVATGPNDRDVRDVQLYGKTFRLNVIRDLAIFRMKRPLSRKGMHGVPLFPGRIKAGDVVTVFSYPKGKLTVTSGHFRSIMERGILKFDLDSALAPGCSGGLILNAQHQAIGVVFGLDSSGYAVFGVPMWSLAEFVETIDPTLYASLFPLPPQRPNSNAKPSIESGLVMPADPPSQVNPAANVRR
jgi:Trypsin-like peptidase domain